MINILKKAVSAVTAAALTFCAVTVIYAKDTEENKTLDIVGALKIADKTELDTVATRADLAHVGVGLMNGYGGNGRAEQVFSDVDGCVYSEDIYTAYISGIMLGDGAGAFHPDEQITKNDAVAVMGRVLGYAAFERTKWKLIGFDESKLIKGIRFSSPMTVGELYQLAENCLDMEVMLRGNDLGEETFEKTGETALEHYFDAYKNTGIVSANSISGLVSGAMNSAVDTVIIDGISYDIGETDAYRLFGLECDFYYMESDGDFVLLTIAKSKDADVLNLSSEKVDDFQDRRYIYSDGGSRSKKSKAISKTADILYNGKAVSDLTNISFYDEDWNGEVTLIDNDGDNQYEVVFLYRYENYIVTSVDTDKNVIYDSKHNTSLQVGDDAGRDYEIYIDGEKGELSEIKTDSVVSVFDSGADYKLIYACRNILSAKLDSVSSEDREIEADGIKYLVCNQEEFDKTKNKIGDTIKFYLDSAGKIAYIDADGIREGTHYGIVTKMILDEDEEDHLIVKIFDSDGTFKRLIAEKKLKINQKSYKIKEEGEWKDFWPDGTTDKRRLAEYKVSEDGRLTSIQFAKDTEYNDLSLGKAYTGFRRVYIGDGKSLTYKLAGAHFVNTDTSVLGVLTTFETDNSTVVFTIPNDQAAADSYYSIGNASYSNNEGVTCDMYRTGESKTIPFMVVKGDETRSEDQRKRILVKKIVETVNEDDEAVVGIEGTIDGKIDQTLYIKSQDSFRLANGNTLEEEARTLHAGDYLTYRVNTKNEIVYFMKMFDYENESSYVPASVGVDTPRYIYGKITGYRDGIVTLVEKNGVEQSYKYSGNVIVHHPRSQSVESSEVLVYGKMMGLYIQESRVMDGVLYE